MAATTPTGRLITIPKLGPSVEGIGACPGSQGLLCHRDGGVHVLWPSIRDSVDHLLGRRVDHLDRSTGNHGHFVVADKHPCHRMSFSSSTSALSHAARSEPLPGLFTRGTAPWDHRPPAGPRLP